MRGEPERPMSPTAEGEGFNSDGVSNVVDCAYEAHMVSDRVLCGEVAQERGRHPVHYATLRTAFRKAGARCDRGPLGRPSRSSGRRAAKRCARHRS